MNYKKHLPHINVETGQSRVLNNTKLYISLLGRFQARQMVDELFKSIVENDRDEITGRAHAIKGAAANLSLPVLEELATEVEKLSKEGKAVEYMCQPLEDAVTALEDAISEITGSLD